MKVMGSVFSVVCATLTRPNNETIVMFRIEKQLQSQLILTIRAVERTGVVELLNGRQVIYLWPSCNARHRAHMACYLVKLVSGFFILPSREGLSSRTLSGRLKQSLYCMDGCSSEWPPCNLLLRGNAWLAAASPGKVSGAGRLADDPGGRILKGIVSYDHIDL